MPLTDKQKDMYIDDIEKNMRYLTDDNLIHLAFLIQNIVDMQNGNIPIQITVETVEGGKSEH